MCQHAPRGCVTSRLNIPAVADPNAFETTDSQPTLPMAVAVYRKVARLPGAGNLIDGPSNNGWNTRLVALSWWYAYLVRPSIVCTYDMHTSRRGREQRAGSPGSVGGRYIHTVLDTPIVYTIVDMSYLDVR
jgi:hypothetical protein